MRAGLKLFSLVLFGLQGTAQAVGTGWIAQTTGASWSPRDSMGELVYNNQMWLFGGFAPGRVNQVWRSPDGANWLQATSAAPWSARNLPATLVYDNKMWVIGGFDGSFGTRDVWSSSDGVTWTAATTAAPWARRSAAGAVVFNNRMWLLGGMGKIDGTEHHNDVWSSADGVNWTQETASAPWSQRAMLQSVVYDDKMWVFGGGVYNSAYPYNSQENFGDVWNSSDGVHWTQVTPEAGWRERRFHSAAVFDGRMWMIAGYATENSPLGNRKDVWYSTDGAKWTQLTPAVPWPIRHEASVFTFDDALWVAGGFGDVLYNDVWSYKPATPTWQVNQSSDWLLSTNWAGGVAPTWRGATANLAFTTSAARTLYVNEAITLGTLNFDNPQGFVMSGAGTLTMDALSGGTSITVLTGKQNLNLPLQVADPLVVDIHTGASLLLSDPIQLRGGATVTKNGAGTLSVLSSFRSELPTTLKINGGTVTFVSPLSDPGISIDVDPATLEFVADQYIGALRLTRGGNRVILAAGNQSLHASVESLHVDGRGNMIVACGDQELRVRNDLHVAPDSDLTVEGGLLQTKQMSIDESGKLILGNSAVLITNESLDTVRQMLWHEDVVSQGSSVEERLSYFSNPTAVEIRTGLAGDLNLDQQVNLSDLSIIAVGFDGAGYWSDGDLDFDGLVSIQDLGLLARNWQIGSSDAGNQATLNEALNSLGLPMVYIPEPACTGVLFAGVILATRRRQAVS